MSFASRYLYRRWPLRIGASLLDAAGRIFFRRSAQNFDPAQIRRILAIRLDHLGDVLMLRPALSALHRAFPNAQIDLLLSRDLAPLFRHQPEIRNLIESDGHWFSRRASLRTMIREFFRLTEEIKSRQYDLAIDFRGDLRHILMMHRAGIPARWGYGVTGGGFLLTREAEYDRAMHQVGLNFHLIRDLVPPFASDAVPPITVSAEQADDFWGRFTAEFKLTHDRPRILVHPSAGYPSKRWPASNYQELIRRLVQDKAGQVILLGTEAERGQIAFDDLPAEELLDLRGRTRLEDLPVLMDACQLFIGNDSGPAHLAAAQGLPVIAIFSGTNLWKVWHPWSQKLKLVRYDVPCSPCESRICPLRHHDCMTRITVEEVYTLAVSALSGSAA